MILTFDGPTFFAPEDEDRFFGWLYSLPEYKRVVGVGTELELELSSPVSPSTVVQLLVLFRRWGMDPAALLPLRSAENGYHVLWDNPLFGVSRET
jgi:hypothetical protein